MEVERSSPAGLERYGGHQYVLPSQCRSSLVSQLLILFYNALTAHRCSSESLYPHYPPFNMPTCPAIYFLERHRCRYFF
jgi:hypothetical protein